VTVALSRSEHWFPVASLTRRLNVGVVFFVALYAAIALKQHNYIEPAGFMNFLRRAAPLAILASGQVFVIVSGGFDLSVGSLVTLCVLGASMITGGDPALTWPAIAALYAMGLAVGLINGVAVAYLKVPSIIATLGMLLSVNGVAMMWSGGSPRGYLPDNFRAFGRLVFHDVPVIGTMPLSVIILVLAAALACWGLHGSVFGRRVFAVGDNPRAAELAGVRVDLTRIACFLISALSAVTAGILLGGFAGVSTDVGQGLELQAIAACVIGGAQLMGGRGTVIGAIFGALSLFALFTLLNLLGLPQALRDTAQGLILISSVAAGARRQRGGG
jgi:ribose transport system permease protein